MTVMPVLGGAGAGVTVTVSSVVPPEETAAGFALPVAPKPHEFCGEELACGFGVVAVKSPPLFRVSVQPPEPRTAAVVFESVAAATTWKQFAPPAPVP